MRLLASRLGFFFRPVPIQLTWSSTQSGIIAGQEGGWGFSNGGTFVKFDIQNSANCGGPNPYTQSGVATATIIIAERAYSLTPVLAGFGEAQDPGFEIMNLRLAGGAFGSGIGTLLTNAKSSGGGLGCANGTPVTQTNFISPPYTLQAFTTYTFRLDFTTSDNYYHVNCYYNCSLNFTPL